MKPSLLSVLPVNPPLPIPSVTTSLGADRGPSELGFMRALNEARQAAGAANEATRAPPRDSEGAASGERARRSESSERAERGERRAREDGADDADRDGADQASDDDVAQARARSAAASARAGELARRAQAAARAESRAQAATAHGAAAAPAEDATCAATDRLHQHIAAPGAEAGDPLALHAVAAEDGRLLRDPAEAAAAVLAGRGAALGARADAAASTATAAEARRALGRVAQRGAVDGGAAAAGEAEVGAGRARPAPAAARPGADDAGAPGASAPSARSLRLALAEAATAALQTGAEAMRERVLDGATGRSASAAAGPLPGALPAFNPATTALAGAPGHGALHEATLATGPGHEGFARELGAQVSFLVREGVQQARLQLHPLELGPVLVRIQLDGQTAQVHMAADLPQTRQALEQALPALASQLSEAGITLAGGGVSEQAAQGFGNGEREARGDAGRRDDGSAAAGAPPQGMNPPAEGAGWSRARGIVDLVA